MIEIDLSAMELLRLERGTNEMSIVPAILGCVLLKSMVPSDDYFMTHLSVGQYRIVEFGAQPSASGLSCMN